MYRVVLVLYVRVEIAAQRNGERIRYIGTRRNGTERIYCLWIVDVAINRSA